MPTLPLEQLVTQLIAIPSVSNDTQQCINVLDFCEEYMSDVPMSVKRYESNGHHSMVVSSADTLQPDVMFIAHLDVVPAPLSAYTAVEKDGKIFGRGAYDMKGPAAVALNTCRAYLQTQATKSIAIMLTTDEEIGGEHGVGYLLDVIGYKPQCAIVPDAGGNFSLVTLQYGILRLAITRRGKAAHSSRPEDGDNAVHSFIKDFDVFQQKIAAIPDTVMSIVDIRAGIAMNITPDVCDVKIDIRTAHHDRVQTLVAQTFRPSEYTYLADHPVFVANPNDPHIAAYSAIAAQELGRPIAQTAERGSCDSRYLTPYAIPGIVTNCIGGGLHEDVEWVDSESMHTLQKIFLRYLQS